MPRYLKLGTITKKDGLILYEFEFNYSLINNGVTEVYVIKKPREKNDCDASRNMGVSSDTREAKDE